MMLNGLSSLDLLIRHNQLFTVYVKDYLKIIRIMFGNIFNCLGEIFKDIVQSDSERCIRINKQSKTPLR
jgi:hypothetical protein